MGGDSGEEVRVEGPCCGPSSSGCCGQNEQNGQKVENGAGVAHDDVSEYYRNLTTSKDLLTSACLMEGEETREVRQLVRNVHPEILDKFYGCGSPIPPLLKDCTVVDLGCGTGRDVYVAAQLVGENGKVIGIDMTAEQLDVAERHRDWQRQKFGVKALPVEFKHAKIEDVDKIGIPAESVDVIISNCVINLAPEKGPVLEGVSRLLKVGGELYFSDVFCSRRVPDHLQKDKVLFGECLSGALYWGDFQRLMNRVGLPLFGVTSVRQLSISNSNPELAAKLEGLSFFSVTVRAVKVARPDLEEAPEDYGQVATYKGAMPGQDDRFVLDTTRTFPVGQPVSVDVTTAAMLTQSRYSLFFDVTERGLHKGPKKYCKPPASSYGAVLEKYVTVTSTAGKAGGGCC